MFLFYEQILITTYEILQWIQPVLTSNGVFKGTYWCELSALFQAQKSFCWLHNSHSVTLQCKYAKE